MSDSDPVPAAVERYAAAGVGGVLLLIATSLCAWGVRLTVAGLSPAGWPPGLGSLLLPVGLTVVVIGFGSWRLLRMGVPARIFGMPLGRAVLVCFAIAAVGGALV